MWLPARSSRAAARAGVRIDEGNTVRQNQTVPKLLSAFGIHAALLLGACSSAGSSGPKPTVSLPLNTAWMDGHRVEYITTDISDRAMAQALRVNLVPRLGQAIVAPGR